MGRHNPPVAGDTGQPDGTTIWIIICSELISETSVTACDTL